MGRRGRVRGRGRGRVRVKVRGRVRVKVRGRIRLTREAWHLGVKPV